LNNKLKRKGSKSKESKVLFGASWRLRKTFSEERNGVKVYDSETLYVLVIFVL
jgi:hypothetical protein